MASTGSETGLNGGIDMKVKIGRQYARSVVAAAALLVGTIAIGAVARHPGAGGVVPGSEPTLSFSAPAGGPVSFGGQLDSGAVLQGGDGLVRMELRLRAEGQGSIAPVGLPTDLVVVLDRSGSMRGQKISDARAAIRELVGQLGARDRFALVTYSTGARLALPLHETERSRREAIRAAIERVVPDGGTNLSSGLDLALEVVERARVPGREPRVVVISDGLVNQGDTSLAGLTARAGRAAVGEYVLSTVGVGEDFDEGLLTALADAGTGNYYYLADARALASVFSDEFFSARETVARGLEVRIQPRAGVSVLEAAGYPLERRGGSVSFRPGSLFADQERRIWVTLRVPSREPGETGLGRFALAYSAGGESREIAFGEEPRVACVADRGAFLAAVDEETLERGLVVDGYNAMRQRVADSVKAGDREDALEQIRLYQRRALGYGLDSPALEAQVNEAERLGATVEEVFAAPEPAREQNAFSKELGARARDERRPGGKR
jgi:Ca-activated chloride channel family protein